MAETAKGFPPIPHKVKLTVETGFMAPPWEKWFRDLYDRVGGVLALSNVQLAQLQQDQLDDVLSDVAIIQAQIAGLQAQVALNLKDVLQGPTL